MEKNEKDKLILSFPLLIYIEYISSPIKEDEQVSLEFVVATQTPKQLFQSITQAIIHHTATNHHTRNNNGKKNSLVAAPSTSNNPSPQVVGIARVPHHGTVGKRETRRYKLANPNQVKGWDLDLTVELSYTQAQQQQQKKQQPPWTFYTHTSDLADNDDQDEQCDQETLTQAQTHCRNGDYLTFYVRGKTFPVSFFLFFLVLPNPKKKKKHYKKIIIYFT